MDIEAIAAKAKTQLKSEKKAEARDAAPGPSPEIEKTKEPPMVEATSPKEEERPVEKPKETPAPPTKPEPPREEKSNLEKRVFELLGERKNLEERLRVLEEDNSSTKAEKDAIKTELDGIKKQLSLTPEDKQKTVVQEEIKKRREKYLTEDAKLPRAERREMSKEELDEWAVEDYEGAQEWITNRTIRRNAEYREIHDDLQTSAKANEILAKQLKSAERTYVKHPELSIKAREDELMKQGKSIEETHKIIASENPKWKMVTEIFSESPDKFIVAENGPELIVSEMERRMSKPAVKKDESEAEKLKAENAALKAENERLKGLDTTVTSTRSKEPSKEESDLDKKQAELARKAGLDPAKVAARIKKRKEMGLDE